jgi:hypothetical protein
MDSADLGSGEITNPLTSGHLGNNYSGQKVYSSVPLKHGNNISASAMVKVNKMGDVTEVNIIDGGTGYSTGEALEFAGIFETLFANRSPTFEVGNVDSTAIQDVAFTGNATTYATGCIKETYQDVSLIGGSGSGATGNFTIDPANGTLKLDTITDKGVNYQVGDVLTVDQINLGGFGGSGWSIVVSDRETDINYYSTSYICQASGGSGTGLEVRLTKVPANVHDSVGQISPITVDDIVSRGRDYLKDETVTLSNTQGTGSYSDVEILKVG